MGKSTCPARTLLCNTLVRPTFASRSRIPPRPLFAFDIRWEEQKKCDEWKSATCTFHSASLQRFFASTATNAYDPLTNLAKRNKQHLIRILLRDGGTLYMIYRQSQHLVETRNRMLQAASLDPHPGTNTQDELMTAKHGPAVVNHKAGCGTAALWKWMYLPRIVTMGKTEAI